MYSKIVLHGADFSNDALDLYEAMTASVGSVDIVFGTSNFGKPITSEARLRADDPNTIFIPKGGSVVIKGLKNLSDNSLFLKVDGVLYSSNDPVHENAVHSINGDHSTTSYYFPLNGDGDDEITWTNPYNEDYHVRFCFKQSDGENITLSDYSISYIA